MFDTVLDCMPEYLEIPCAMAGLFGLYIGSYYLGSMILGAEQEDAFKPLVISSVVAVLTFGFFTAGCFSPSELPNKAGRLALSLLMFAFVGLLMQSKGMEDTHFFSCFGLGFSIISATFACCYLSKSCTTSCHATGRVSLGEALLRRGATPAGLPAAARQRGGADRGDGADRGVYDKV